MEKKKILIVDDEEHVLIILENRLVNAGYTVIKATNGGDAINLAKKEIPALIITDVSMPDIDGGGLTAALADDRTTKDIPILYLTALLRKEEEKERRVVLGRHFIAKPYDPEELLREVAKLISGPQV
ncbi:MAG: response regulator [Candidatus Omnitrophota bacterium]|nr:response regulator [Candidatus Omnitrophota bacterium]